VKEAPQEGHFWASGPIQVKELGQQSIIVILVIVILFIAFPSCALQIINNLRVECSKYIAFHGCVE